MRSAGCSNANSTARLHVQHSGFLPNPLLSHSLRPHLGLHRVGQRIHPPRQRRQRRLLGGRQVRRERLRQAVRKRAAVARRLQRRQRRRRALQQRGRAQRRHLPVLGFKICSGYE